MGFKSVYSVLTDLFPQVDTRILRAVAIENKNDADKAAEIVLTEVIPNIASTSASVDDFIDNTASHENDTVCWDPENLNENVGHFKVSSSDVGNTSGDQVCGLNENDIVSLVKLSNVNGHNLSPLGSSSILTCEDMPSNQCVGESNQLCSNVQSLDLNTSPVKLSNIGGHTESTHETSTILNCVDVPSNLESLPESRLEQLFSNAKIFTGMDDFENEPTEEKTNELIDFEHKPIYEKYYHELVDFEHEPVLENSTLEVDFEHEPVGENSTLELVDFEHEPVGENSTLELVDFEDENLLKTVVSGSGHICKIDLLENIMEEAKYNKKTLFLAMESVMSLMKEVEVKEKEAEQLKEEAARGPLDILTNVEDLKQMLIHAKEANDMHAGEVYGEKAILATEAKELQSRLLCLSDERDNSLAILDDMRRTLEQRLDAAEKEMKAAEQEKMENEERARNALAEQQMLMDKLVQESKILKQEAEENSKLQEFLMDRGRVVDMLQGEISVICQDVKLLKQKFDERVPLSESLSSSQTSCKLASSSSSLKSLPLDQLPTRIETPKRSSPNPSISNHSDDEWEFFEKKELNL